MSWSRHSVLRSDHGFEYQDTFTVRDSKVPVIRLCYPDPQQSAMLREDCSYVVGEIAEEVANVRVLRDASARQLGVKAVYDAAAIRVDQTTDESAGMLVG